MVVVLVEVMSSKELEVVRRVFLMVFKVLLLVEVWMMGVMCIMEVEDNLVGVVLVLVLRLEKEGMEIVVVVMDVMEVEV